MTEDDKFLTYLITMKQIYDITDVSNSRCYQYPILFRFMSEIKTWLSEEEEVIER
jgi:hypothetical protein